MRQLLLTIMLCAAASCTAMRPSAGTDLTRVVVGSHSFRRALEISPERARWRVDGSDDGCPVIYVGFDEGTHYTRFATLRIREDGAIEREELREDGELVWVEDD